MRKKPRRGRDVEKGYSKAQYVAKLRRMADAIENGTRQLRWNRKTGS